MPIDAGDEEPVHALDGHHRVFPGDEVLEMKRSGGERTEVDARAKATTGTGEDDDTHIGRALDPGHDVAQVAHPGRIGGVEHLGALKRHASDRAVDLEANGAHGRTSARTVMSPSRAA